MNGHRDVGYVRLAAVQHDDGEDVCALEVDACFGSLLYEVGTSPRHVLLQR